MKITLTNNFHNTEINLVVLSNGGGNMFSKSQVAKARKALCGIKGCTCGGMLGERGPQYGKLTSRLGFEPQSDGRVKIFYDRND